MVSVQEKMIPVVIHTQCNTQHVTDVYPLQWLLQWVFLHLVLLARIYFHRFLFYSEVTCVIRRLHFHSD